MAERDEELEDLFEARIRRQGERMARGRREGDRSFWRHVGVVGTIGWSVALPMAVGGLFGAWLDGRAGTGSRWTLVFLLLGLALGLANAWRMLTSQEGRS